MQEAVSTKKTRTYMFCCSKGVLEEAMVLRNQIKRQDDLIAFTFLQWCARSVLLCRFPFSLHSQRALRWCPRASIIEADTTFSMVQLCRRTQCSLSR
eukprot:scaffold43696_cov48-Attheya_sp.AAC.11